MQVPHRLLSLTAAASVAAFGVAAVAVAQDDSAAGTGASATAARTTSLRISANSKNQLRFSTKHLKARRGRVTIVMSNPSALPHGVAVEGHGVDKDGKIVTKGGQVQGDRDAQARDLHVLLPVRRPPQGRHAGQARRALTGARARRSAAWRRRGRPRPRAGSVWTTTSTRPGCCSRSVTSSSLARRCASVSPGWPASPTLTNSTGP